MIYECKFCHKTFDKKFNYDRHRRHVKYCVENKTINFNKTTEEREICYTCGKTFKNKFTLKRHQLNNCENLMK